MAARGFTYVDARPEAEAAWTNFVREGQKNLLMGDIKSWFTGVNTNIDGRDKPRVVLYVGSASAYRERCDEVKNGGYRERSEEHTSELQSLMRISYAVFCLKKKKRQTNTHK